MPSNYQTHEHDPRWSAVDAYASQHLFPASSALYDPLDSAARRAASAGLPDIAVSPLQGQFLALQCKFVGARHILEVGTLGGYSSIWLAGSDPEARVTTVEVDPEHAAVARASVDAAGGGLGARVEILVGSGTEVLPRLKAEVLDGRRPRWDFVFIDADKQNNLFYLERAVEMSRPGACIVVDNVVRKGGVADERAAEMDVGIRGSRAVIEAAAKDGRVDATLMQTVGEKNYDGMLICRVK